jgi:DNA repair exonuclease SbcCD nuclease subunit
MHQAVEGARVGTHDYTFRAGRDVVAAALVPEGFAAVLAGHIHRFQVLRCGRSAPVLYPGSVERTSFVEREEEKGYLMLRFEPGPAGGRLAAWRFVRLPTRPMAVFGLDGARADFADALRRRLARCVADSVVRVDVRGEAPLSAGEVRALAPATMNVTLNARDPALAARRP